MDKDARDGETLEIPLREAAGAAPGRSGGLALGSAPPAEMALGSEPPGSRQELLRNIHLKVRVELGRSRVPLEDALELVPGSTLDLDKPVGDPVDLYVGDLHVARGDVLVVNDSFCVRITEVLSQGTGEETGGSS